MQYLVGEFRQSIDNYFFETDETYIIYVYQKGTMNYLDMIKGNYKFDYDEFIFRCNEWISNH